MENVTMKLSKNSYAVSGVAYRNVRMQMHPYIPLKMYQNI